jgi:hypothetical protein
MYCNDDDEEMRYLSQWVVSPMPKHSTWIHPLCKDRERIQGKVHGLFSLGWRRGNGLWVRMDVDQVQSPSNR